MCVYNFHSCPAPLKAFCMKCKPVARDEIPYGPWGIRLLSKFIKLSEGVKVNTSVDRQVISNKPILKVSEVYSCILSAILEGL